VPLGHYPEAAETLKECENSSISWQNSGGAYNPGTHVGLVFAYSQLGREQEARNEAAQVLRISPGFSLEKMQRRSSGINWQDPQPLYFLAVLRKAGLR
jgi:hypothetical protein